ncbi:cell wall anchor protein [Plantactinospora soyae]|uniref:Cell wall anchor protein n=1 Tax=Plantactinospora soyae TaxID=1544732 RepID=A0A927M6J2_9ACTN|nr:cell wall anchor protein [Plantactinospora soyae]MBE1487790.1 hypothetical protein [Plantactinospora soyae]
MIRPKLSLRRPLALATGLLLGVAGAVAFAAPASAHHPEIFGAGCELDNGDIKVVWTVANSEKDWDAEITQISSPSGATVTGLGVGTKLPKLSSGGPAPTGEQTVPAGQNAELTVTAFWDKKREDVTNTRTGRAKLKGKCEEPEPEPTPTPTTPAPTPTTPGPTPPATTPPATPSPTPSVPEPGEATFELKETCDELIIIIDNPADGEAFSIRFQSEKGVVRTLEAIPGQVTSVSFDAYEGLTVIANSGGEEGPPVRWTKPEDCESGGGGGELPLTGAAAGGIAGGAVLLLAAGVVLFVVARRRRVTFTV